MQVPTLQPGTVIDADDETFGLLPARAHDRPSGWVNWPLSRRIEYTFGQGLDNLETVLSWEPNNLDAIRFRGWKEATLAIVNIGARYGLQRMKTDDAAALRQISRKLKAHGAETQDIVRNRQKRGTTETEKP